MRASSTNRNIVLTFASQQFCVQLQAKDVVFYIPNGDGSVLEFQTQRRFLHKLKSKLSCKGDCVQLSLTTAEGNEMVLDSLAAKAANQYRQDIDAAKRLLAESYWSRASAKTFSVGAVFGGAAVVISAFWFVTNNVP